MTAVINELPAVALPSDAQAARELIEEVLELAREEQAGRELIERLEAERASPVEFVI